MPCIAHICICGYRSSSVLVDRLTTSKSIGFHWISRGEAVSICSPCVCAPIQKTFAFETLLNESRNKAMQQQQQVTDDHFISIFIHRCMKCAPFRLCHNDGHGRNMNSFCFSFVWESVQQFILRGCILSLCKWTGILSIILFFWLSVDVILWYGSKFMAFVAFRLTLIVLMNNSIVLISARTFPTTHQWPQIYVIRIHKCGDAVWGWACV